VKIAFFPYFLVLFGPRTRNFDFLNCSSGILKFLAQSLGLFFAPICFLYHVVITITADSGGDVEDSILSVPSSPFSFLLLSLSRLLSHSCLFSVSSSLFGDDDGVGGFGGFFPVFILTVCSSDYDHPLVLVGFIHEL